MIEIIIALLFIAGSFFLTVGALGVVRFPDFYTRMHPAGKCDTLGQSLILLGLMIYEGASFVSIKLLFIIIFIFIANPTATHALAKAAYVAGVKPWKEFRQEAGEKCHLPCESKTARLAPTLRYCGRGR
ncbi:MAG: monovalent cation/H(+) antiporter subunit G [Candidatus Hydrothermarchaeota archaeon]|nr:monovalent cation/H(+) antiporter subunit G [Candidatus Hydrothermarchaeota archaeon]